MESEEHWAHTYQDVLGTFVKAFSLLHILDFLWHGHKKLHVVLQLFLQLVCTNDLIHY